MVIGIIGENCSGKSTLAEKIGSRFNAEIITGKDYLRMAKSQSEAEALFRAKLENAVSGDNIIYVISEPDHLKLLPDGAVRILVSADIYTIKERFKERMHGNLPAPVARMLENKHGIFDDGTYDLRFDGVKGDAEYLCADLEYLKGMNDGRHLRVISNQVRFGCGYRMHEGKRQFFAFHGYPARNDDFFTTSEISEAEYKQIGFEYPREIIADRETAEEFRKKYVDGHPIILEGMNKLL